MMAETGKTHQELMDMVTSPKGTTLMGLPGSLVVTSQKIIGGTQPLDRPKTG